MMMSDGTVAMSYVIKDDAERLENTQASICNPSVTEGSCTQLTFKKVQLFKAATALLQILRSSMMEIDEACVDNMWNLLKGAIQQILKKDTKNLCFPELYKIAHTLLHQRRVMKMYTGLEEILRDHLINDIQPQVLHALHNNFLPVLVKAWNFYQHGIRMIEDIFICLDQIYTKNGMDSALTIGFTMFKEHVLADGRIKQHLQRTLLLMIEQDRKGERERESIRDVCKMLMILSLHSRSVYEEYFEEPFLKVSAQLFQVESQELLVEKNADKYLKRVEDRIVEEEDRVFSCLDISTKDRIIEVVEREMIINHMRTIVEMETSGLVYMLEHSKTQDLARMYRLFSRVQGGLKMICKTMSPYVRRRGKALFSDREIDLNAVDQIQSLLEWKAQCDHFLTESFNNNKLCKNTIVEDFEHIFNQNSHSPEYLSLFIDSKLKKGVKHLTEFEVEGFLDKAMMLFKLLQEKDLFEKFYKQHLSIRLLGNKNVSENMEKSMILRLKTECGFEFTAKLERMFKDVTISTAMKEEFCSHIQTMLPSLNGLNLSVKVLTSGFWPTQTQTPKCNLPPAPFSAYEVFRRFYLNKHTGRQLMLQCHLGWADVNATFYGPLKDSSSEANVGGAQATHKHILQVSTFQMVILMLFNSREQFTYKEIQQETDIPDKDLVRALLPLFWGKPSHRVLIKEPGSKDMEKEDIYKVNDEFSSKQYKVKMKTVGTKKETLAPEKKEVQHKVEEERRHRIEAAIIRIVKSRNKMQHQVLVTEVMQQLQESFLPSPAAIKKCIEGLIDREYLARSPEDHKTYIYIT